MCFQHNLKYIKTLPKSQFKAMNVHPGKLPLDMREGIVKKALYKFLSPEMVEEVKQQRRSNSTPEALIEDFKKTDQPYHPIKKDWHYRRALKVATELFRPKQAYKPVAFPDLRYYPWKLNVSAEAPYSSQPKWAAYLAKKFSLNRTPSSQATFRNLFDELFHINRLLVHKIKDGDRTFFEADGTPRPYYWVNLHARAHVVGPDDDDKIRAVFGVPKLLLFVENMFIWPMQADLLNREVKDSPLLWGCEIMKGGWKRLRSAVNLKTDGLFKSVLSTDWSQFDRRALFSVIDDVHDIWKSFFDLSGSYQPTNFYPDASTSQHRIENLWKWMTDMVKHYPIVLPDGTMYQWTVNGIASGYMQTQLLDSWVNMIMLLTCLSELGINIESPRFFIKVQGDDSICSFLEDIFRTTGKGRFIKKMASIALTRFNAKLSVEKTDLHDRLDGVKVLGYYNTQGLAWRTEVDLLSHLYFPERPQSLEATAGTALGIAIAAQGCSRAVYDVCQDVFSFITEELGREAILNASTFRNLTYMGYTFQDAYFADLETLVPDSFPSFLGTWMQNYILESRSESARQRSWPTDPSRSGGFIFI
jgi:hypothetical protein